MRSERAEAMVMPGRPDRLLLRSKTTTPRRVGYRRENSLLSVEIREQTLSTVEQRRIQGQIDQAWAEHYAFSPQKHDIKTIDIAWAQRVEADAPISVSPYELSFAPPADPSRS